MAYNEIWQDGPNEAGRTTLSAPELGLGNISTVDSSKATDSFTGAALSSSDGIIACRLLLPLFEGGQSVTFPYSPLESVAVPVVVHCCLLELVAVTFGCGPVVVTPVAPVPVLEYLWWPTAAL